jgi:UDP-N-acetylglucosamine transferase subunit ALG13
VTPLVVALAGTDHHPFERLVEWIDAAAQRRHDARFVIQYGLSRPPTVAEGHRFLVHDHLVALLSVAAVVVCHGGPGLITEAREAGHVPLCVPRDPGLGEHVDGHQLRFAAMADREGLVRTVLSREAFHAGLDESLAHTGAGGPVTVADVSAGARALAAAELDELLSTRPFRLARLHRV